MKKKVWIPLLLGVVLLAGIFLYRGTRSKKPEWQEVPVTAEKFVVNVPASGTIQPENKISITSPIAGRIEQILHEEGTKVKRGGVLAWMSSTDRAALLDTARAQGQSAIKEWENVYKPTPILAPANGEIISKQIVVGQTVNQQTVLFELSYRLVVIADVDETDLGKIHVGQAASVKVDSYPNLVVPTQVARIAHQSKLKNAINTYEVLLLPEKLPKEFRAGLTASVQFLYKEKAKALVVPTWVAEGRENFSADMQVKGKDGKPENRSVKFGDSNGQQVEIDGVAEGEILLVSPQEVLTEGGGKPSPFGVRVGGRGRR